jgi:gliding motility-associated-like protein
MPKMNLCNNSTNSPPRVLLVLLGFIMFTGPTAFSQVEVLNGGFEICKGYPSSSGMWQMMNDWTNAGSATANPDFYHMDGNNGGDLPETPMAIIDSYQGRAIAGLEVSRRSGTNKREYLMGAFSEPLEIGIRYEFSFAIANGDVYSHSAAGLGVSHLGVAFSDVPFVQTEREPINVHPNFYLNYVHYYHGWKIIKFAFTASEESRFFTFGMFGDDTGKTIQSYEGPGKLKAYYFVDDFSIRTLTSELQNENSSDDKGELNELFNLEPDTYVPTAFTPNGDGINDEFVPSLRANRGAVMRIYDRGGALVWHSTGDNINWNGRSLEGDTVRAGVYVWILSMKLEDGSFEELRGPVSLLQ